MSSPTYVDALNKFRASDVTRAVAIAAPDKAPNRRHAKMRKKKRRTPPRDASGKFRPRAAEHKRKRRAKRKARETAIVAKPAGRAVKVNVAGSKRRKHGRGRKVRLTRRRNGRTTHPTVFVSEPRKRARRAHAKRKHRANAPALRRRGYRKNPLSGGETAVALVTGALGAVACDFLTRWMRFSDREKAQKEGKAIPNQAFPTLGTLAVQAASTFVPLLASGWVRSPYGKSALQGFGLGAGVSALAQIANTYMVKYLRKDNETIRDYYPELTAQVAAEEASSKSGLQGVGAIDRRPNPRPFFQIPTPGASALEPHPAPIATVLDAPAPAAPPVRQLEPAQPLPASRPASQPLPPLVQPLPAPAPRFPAPQPQQPGPVYSNGSGPSDCMPCGAESARYALQNAYRAAAETGAGCSIGCGAPPPHLAFPE